MASGLAPYSYSSQPLDEYPGPYSAKVQLGGDSTKVSHWHLTTKQDLKNALVNTLPRWINRPMQREADQQKVKFYRKADFPNVVGCIDCTHIRIQALANNEHERQQEKPAFNVQVYCIFLDFICITVSNLFQGVISRLTYNSISTSVHQNFWISYSDLFNILSQQSLHTTHAVNTVMPCNS